MKPHPRVRKTIKWGGAVVTVFIVSVWIASGWVGCYYISSHGAVVEVAGGRIGVIPCEDGAPIQDSRGAVGLLDKRPVWLWWGFARGISPQGVLYPNVVFVFLDWIWIPLWVFVAPSLLVTAAAWRLDILARRAHLNLCPKCTYDRAGLTAGAKCPECGHPTG